MREASYIYSVIHKSLRDFRSLRYSSRDGYAEGAHVNSSCHTHVMHVCGSNLITGLTSAASPRVDILSTCKVGQNFGVSLPLLTCSPSAWPSRLLYRRGRKSRRDLRITLYTCSSFSLSVCLPACPQGTTRLPLDGLSWNLPSRFPIPAEKIYALLNVRRMTGYLHEGLRSFMVKSGWNLLRKRKVSNKSCIENPKKFNVQ